MIDIVHLYFNVTINENIWHAVTDLYKLCFVYYNKFTTIPAKMCNSLVYACTIPLLTCSTSGTKWDSAWRPTQRMANLRHRQHRSIVVLSAWYLFMMVDRTGNIWTQVDNSQLTFTYNKLISFKTIELNRVPLGEPPGCCILFRILWHGFWTWCPFDIWLLVMTKKIYNDYS